MRPKGIHTTEWWKYNLYFLAEHFLGYTRLRGLFGSGRRKLFEKIDRRLKKEQHTTSVPVPELDSGAVPAATKATRDLMKRPVVFRGAAADWPCTKKWDLDFFEKEFGEIEVHLVDTVGAVDPEHPQKFETISLAEYIGQLREGTRKYLKFSNLVQEKMKLREDIDQQWISRFEWPGSIGKRFYFFIGGKGSVTPLHNEFPPVVYIQVHGRKRWVFYDSNDRIYLDPRTERRHYFYSNANPSKPHDENYPLLKYATKQEVVLEPGDVLWFPPFAWHYVENLSDSIGVAYKFSHIPQAFKASKMLTSLYFMATRPMILVNFLQHRFGRSTVDTRKAKPVKSAKS